VARLPDLPRIVSEPGELGFPEPYPVFQPNIPLSWRHENMKMIWHENIAPHRPGEALLPDPNENFVVLVLREPWTPVLCADREQDNARPVVDIQADSVGGSSPPRAEGTRTEVWQGIDPWLVQEREEVYLFTV